MKNNVESPQAYVNRVMQEQNLTHLGVAERARRLGHKISGGYVHNIARGVADNPSIQLMQALAAGLGRPEDEVDAVFRGKPLTQEANYNNSLFAAIWNEYRNLSASDQKELRPMIDMLQREVQRRLKD